MKISYKKFLTNYSILFLGVFFFHRHSFANTYLDEALQRCRDEALAYGDGSGRDEISFECINLIKSQAQKNAAKQVVSFKDEKTGEKLIFYGQANMIIFERLSLQGVLLQREILAGKSTTLKQVTFLRHNFKHDLYVVDSDDVIKIFSHHLFGNVAPQKTVEEKGKKLSLASAISFDEVAQHFSVTLKLPDQSLEKLTYPYLANTKSVRHKALSRSIVQRTSTAE
jgi:hypothetical protein